jgi:Fe-S cluster assembly protein SufD
MVTQIAKHESSYAAAFHDAMEKAGRVEPLWLRQFRENAFEHFERVGFPTVAEEDWKYTNVAPLAKMNFAPASVDFAQQQLSEPDSITSEESSSGGRLVFLNGILQKELSSFAGRGVVAMDLGDALKNSEYEPKIREHLGRYANAELNGFTALNAALFSSGAFVLIPAGVKVEAPIHLVFVSETTNGAGPFASFPRVLVVAEKGSEATLLESYESTSDEAYLNDAIVEIALEEEARLKHYKIQREGLGAFHVATTKADLGRDSSYDTTTINLGAALSRHDIGVTMDHEDAECWVDGLYMIDGSQHSDTHSVIDHRKPRCVSHQLYKGIMDGKSRAVFNGKVHVRHDAQQTDARQTNKNLLLSNDARVDTKPQLEIFADDVKCAHGAAIGQLAPDELFYLESRGINPQLARNLLTYGFAEEVIEKIKIESIKRELDEAVLNRLHSDLHIEA